MNDLEADRIRKRAMISATRIGFGRHSEDIAQEVLLHFIQGKGQHQTVDQAVIDAVRRTFGRPGTPGFERRRDAEQRAGTLDDVASGAMPAVTQSHAFDFERIIERIRGEDRAAVILIYEYGFNEEEVGRVFGVSGSRISQRISGLHARLRGAFLEGEQASIQKEGGDGASFDIKATEAAHEEGITSFGFEDFFIN